ncbi:DNA replication and repair protein RecF, partial [Gammaproteobacteria bacterium]|nr:DNA replication and repair protein RecF [Gammaproteobacteria bacterium]
LAVAMRLAQSLYLYETQERTTLYLVDELPAELDTLRCERILSMLQELDSQTLITTVSAESVKYPSLDAVNWFHVEHQQVKAVL